MTLRKQAHWPLRPSLAAHALEGLSRALDNIAFEYSDEHHDELVGVMIAIQVFSAALSAFFTEQAPADERVLEGIEARWLKGSQVQSADE